MISLSRKLSSFELPIKLISATYIKSFDYGSAKLWFVLKLAYSLKQAKFSFPKFSFCYGDSNVSQFEKWKEGTYWKIGFFNSLFEIILMILGHNDSSSLFLLYFRHNDLNLFFTIFSVLAPLKSLETWAHFAPILLTYEINLWS